MHFSKLLLPVLAGAATTSSIALDLNSTELAAVLAGAGPVITETITVTEYRAVVPNKTPYYRWLKLPVWRNRLPTPSTVSEKQTMSQLGQHHSPGMFVHPLLEMTNSATHSTSTLGIYKQSFTKYRHIRLACETSMSQPASSVEPLRPSKGVESKLLKGKTVEWIPDIEIPARIHTIYPTWSISYKKWHGPYSHLKATAMATAPMKGCIVGITDVTSESAPVPTAFAFQA